LKVRLNPRAERQLAALPRPAAQRVVSALRLLQATPTLGRAYPEDSEFRGLFYKLVVVRARRWSYRVTYVVRADEVVVLYLYPSWYPLTHHDLVSSHDED
jgi:mRNA-degrading endonuclease RelE of RelBE toxin-antitoxin system